MEKMFMEALGSFNFAYMIVVNCLAFFIIKIIDTINGDKPVKKLHKKIILLICVILITIAYITSGYKNYIVLLHSAILAPIAWSWIFKPIAKKLGVSYSTIDDYLN